MNTTCNGNRDKGIIINLSKRWPGHCHGIERKQLIIKTIRLKICILECWSQSHMIISELTGSTSLSRWSPSCLTFLVLTLAAWLCCTLFTVYGAMQSWPGPQRTRSTCLVTLSLTLRAADKSDLWMWRRPACSIFLQQLREEWERSCTDTERECPGRFSGGSAWHWCHPWSLGMR